MRNVVSLGSHVHQVFHADRAHKGPLTSTIVANTIPTSQEEAATASQAQALVARNAMLAANVSPNARSVTIALGTWM